MTLALYRKYRPQSFAEVIGQEHVTEPLISAISNGRLNHAYLFSGPRGCGKTSSARILARSLNCAKGPTPTPCGECDSCVGLSAGGGGSIDVIEIDAASHGGVDDARELRERAVFAPVNSRYKIYVIDEAHMVSSAGFNALLKLVEEPPDYVMFVFATTEPEKVLPTIRSRTHHYPFRLIPPAAMRGLCEKLCHEEGITVEESVYPLVIRAGAGSARDTLSVLDQLIAGAGDEGVTYARAMALLGVTDGSLLDEICEALSAMDGAGAIGVIDKALEAGHDPRRFAADLLERLRDLIVLNQVPDAGSTGLIDVPSEVLERMTGQAIRMGTPTLTRMAEIVHSALSAMRGTTAPRLLLELAMARSVLPSVDDSAAGLLQRIDQLERRMAEGVPMAAPAAAAPPAPAAAAAASQPVPPSAGTSGREAAKAAAAQAAGNAPSPAAQGDQPADRASSAGQPAAAAPSQAEASAATDAAPPSPADAGGSAQAGPATAPPAGQSARAAAQDSWATEPAAPAPQAAPAAAPPAAGGDKLAQVRGSWEQIKQAVKDRKKTVAAFLMEATVTGVDNDTLVLTFRHAFHANALTSDSALPIFTEALKSVLGGSWRVRCEVNEAGAAPPPPPARPASPPPPAAAPPPQAPAPRPEPGPPVDYESEEPPGPEPDFDPPPAAAGGSVTMEQAVEMFEKKVGAKKL
ncbi:DNA polymerase III subunit gamma and tau [Stackebrandtia nassauensis]|uniref:DNA polymerase III subunit gamma/tau n=1 Tax=Stackebrandtia nassauensis (strain DSM 44728 / CIP 108903 / NRRL B-16338 / NBRC 102104 / LLR-40K-21) TaxID=446470 RepID=D3Q2L8_STANL|nr:DNA polymerase III subunit gamma and tau [Stackebrandtia nassauensis]ADD45769.1 DNA polymerase III, subunits gamma and tau [Stackebrandtia nassauensis DSM 44728]